MQPVISRNSGRISEALENVDEWSFDIFELYDATEGISFCCIISVGRPLFFLGMHLYDNYNFKFLYDIEENTMARFLQAVESAYRVLFNSVY